VPTIATGSVTGVPSAGEWIVTVGAGPTGAAAWSVTVVVSTRVCTVSLATSRST
jgi:hypothetical protein